MKIPTSKQLYFLDKETVKTQKITSAQLMERAATKCFDWIHEKFNQTSRVFHVFCGVGDNGGDGLVIARILLQKKYKVKVYIVQFSTKYSIDFESNLKLLNEDGCKPIEIIGIDDFPSILADDIIIDAVFGMGLTRPVEGFVKQLIYFINKQQTQVISIDLPSGMFLDVPSNTSNIIQATYTLTFQFVKLPFLLPNTGFFAGNWQVIDIGLEENFLKENSVDKIYVTENIIKNIYKPRQKFTHKGSFGHVLLIGGSKGKIGAVTLASKAALKAGCGLVTAFVPECGLVPLQSANSEVMVETDINEAYITSISFKVKPTVIAIGPGMGTENKTLQAFEHFLKANKTPLVVDADALNLLSKNKKLLEYLPEDSILTPHPKEFERLVGKWNNDFEKLKLLQQFSDKIKCVVLLKGAHTVICYQNKLYFNSTGNSGLATAGSGDVLTGIISSLLAQQHKPLHATLLGVYIHGKTSEFSKSAESLTAEEIVRNLEDVFCEIKTIS